MSSFTILQFHLSREASDLVNAVGWSAAKVQKPEVAIQLDVKFEGSEGFSAWMSEYFRPVANVHGARDLDQVFEAGNGYAPTGVELVKTDRMHSCSVGDIIHCHETGTYHMVDPEGFTQLLSFMEAA